MYTWFRKGKAAVTSGSDIVRFTGATLTTDPTKPVVGDAFTIDGISLYEIVVIDSDNTGEFIKLQKPYAAATNSNVNYAIIRLASSTQNNKLVAMAAAAINQKQISLDDMYEWYTSEADTVDFLGPDDTIVTLKTYHKLTQEISDVGGNAGSITIVATNIDKVVDVSNNMSSVIAATTSATQAASSAASALASKNAAATSETNAASSAASALASKNAASTSETNALSSKNSAATSATNAANSATAALASKNAAATSETNAASSASSALASKNAAAISETNAAASAFQSFAMSQAQFEAIRAQNNEEFAASGFVHIGKHYTEANNQSYVPINQGMWTHAFTPNALILGVADGATGIPNTATSKVNRPLINIAGVCFYLTYINSTIERTQVKFPQAPDGKATYNKSTGVITNHATVTDAFNAEAADPTNVEVVTDRVDMWGFEAWLEEVSTTNPYIYPNGLIQSQATTMDGIATSASARPVTYYAVFDSDTGSKGKGLNFFALTDAQKKKVLANPKNNLYYLDDGRLVQWRLRQRTIAGAGNGDWSQLSASAPTSADYRRFLSFYKEASRGVTLKAQGIQDSLPYGSLATNAINSFISSGAPSNISTNIDKSGQGIWFVEGTNNSTSVNNHCYYLVCGTVNRLNQGAYHPSFNPSGVSWAITNNGSAGGVWHKYPAVLTSRADCFDYYHVTTNPTGKASAPSQGSIGGNQYGRPDTRAHDAIYADGQGGVCRDMRYSAYGIDSVDFAEADQKVKNGTYRGFEKAVFTKVVNVPSGALYESGYATRTLGSTNQQLIVAMQELYSKYENYPYYNYSTAPAQIAFAVDSAGIVHPVYGHQWIGTQLLINTSPSGYSALRVGDSKLIIQMKIPFSIGGSFLQTDVIGDPANILATPALANGWQGSWIPVIPDGTSKEYIASRKSLNSSVSLRWSDNNGSTWSTTTFTLDSVKNSASSSLVATAIRVWQYQAFARQTEDTFNRGVYGGNLGVGQVFATSDFFLPAQNRGTLLKESLTGGTKGIGTAYTNGPMQVLSVKQLTMNSDKLLSGRAAYDIKHDEIVIDGNTTVNGVKALNYNINLNQQAFIQYAYTELKHNGTNWGDDGKVTIVDNQATKTDLNGNTVLVGTAKLKEPIGWIKNKV